TFANQKLVPPGKVLKADWRKNKHVQQFLKLTALGETPSYGPILLIQGLGEKTIPREQTKALLAKVKKGNEEVTYSEYPGLDHDPVVFGSFRDQLRWVQARFSASEVGR